MKKLLALMLLLTLVGCGKQATTTQTQNNTQEQTAYTIEHSLGSTELKSVPKKIAALEFSYVDALVSLDKKVVAIADDGDKSRIIKEVSSKLDNYISLGSRRTPSLEALIEASPDLIIADPSRHKNIKEELENIAPTIFVDSANVGYDEILKSFELIGKAVGKEQEAKELVVKHKEDMKKDRQSAEKLGNLAIGIIQDGMFALQSNTSYVVEALSDFNIKNAVESDNSRLLLTLEQLVELNPDTLIMMTNVGKEDPLLTEAKANPLWNELKAVKNNRYFEVDRTLWLFSRGLISTKTMADNFEEIIKNAK